MVPAGTGERRPGLGPGLRDERSGRVDRHCRESTTVSAFDATDGSTLFTRESSDVAMAVSGPVVVGCSAAERRCAVEGLAPRTARFAGGGISDGARAWVAGVVDVASRVDIVDGSGLDVTMPFEVPDTRTSRSPRPMDVGNGAGGTGGSTRVVKRDEWGDSRRAVTTAGRVARLVTDRLLLAWDSGQAGCALAVGRGRRRHRTARWGRHRRRVATPTRFGGDVVLP